MPEFLRSIQAELSHVFHPSRWTRRDWTAAWTGFVFGFVGSLITRFLF